MVEIYYKLLSPSPCYSRCEHNADPLVYNETVEATAQVNLENRRTWLLCGVPNLTVSYDGFFPGLSVI